jgi:hypothetical protein
LLIKYEKKNTVKKNEKIIFFFSNERIILLQKTTEGEEARENRDGRDRLLVEKVNGFGFVKLVWSVLEMDVEGTSIEWTRLESAGERKKQVSSGS